MRRAPLWVGGVLVGLVLLTALVSFVWTPYDAAAIVAPKLADPSLAHPLGTDHLGRDIVSRLMVGARATVVVGVVAVALAAGGGVPLGVLAHSTHLKGSGVFEDGVERPRIRVTLASQISREDCETLNLGYADPATIDPAEWQGREDEGVVYIPKAGEHLYRVRSEGR